jgi:hypothetical protein
MPHTTSKDNLIYSVDLMFAYINIFKPKINLINMKDIKGWDDNISVNDVLQNPRKYNNEYKKIIKAKLKYPIIKDIFVSYMNKHL